MLAEILEPIKTKNGTLETGQLVDLSEAAIKRLAGKVRVIDLHRLVGQTLAEVDRIGRPWPARFLANLPAEDRQRLRELERDIDVAVLSGHKNTLTGFLEEWRELLLGCLH
jgi:hypothetical protein